MQDVEKVLFQLPPEARRELLDYAEFLLQKYGRKGKKREVSLSPGMGS